MVRLLFVVPYPELEETVKCVVENHPEKDRLSITIIVCSARDVSSISVSGYDAVIARGYSASVLQSVYPQLPVIVLTISGYDIIRTIAQCQEVFHPKKIAICGFYDKLYEAKNVCRLFGCDTEIYSTVNHEDLDQVIVDAMSKGCDAMIGGNSANMYARKYGINFCLIRTGEDTILMALNEALRTADKIRQERLQAETYKTIIYSSKDGILFVDPDGTIQVRNRVVRYMNGGTALFHRPLQDTFPFLYDVFQEALSKGKEINGKIYTIPTTKLIVSAAFTPVIVKNVISGIVITLSDITQIQKLESQIRRSLSEKGLRTRYHFEDIIHKSEIIDSTIDMARKFARSESNIILVGETGTGKELFAQSIHNASARKNGPFVAINCAALPESLLESELFGYVEGTFTGSLKGGKSGLFEQAHGGTLFLDEVGEISMATQAKLLRALQEREVRRIGDNKVISVNVRIIAATNKNLTQLTEEGKFRRDLMYRLDVLRLFLPPLRQREGDSEILFLHFLKQYSLENGLPCPSVNIEALSLLRDYNFTGNIRELRNIIERVCALYSGQRIGKEDILQALYLRNLEEVSSEKSSISRRPPQDEKQAVLWALEECGGNQTQAARLLGIDRSTLWRKLKKYREQEG
ncbi:sigma 54-interacting transcriptional regulator [Lachnospiraceae bacterium 62-35]